MSFVEKTLACFSEIASAISCVLAFVAFSADSVSEVLVDENELVWCPAPWRRCPKGSMFLLTRGPDGTLQAHLKRSLAYDRLFFSTAQPFDENAWLVVVAYDRSVQDRGWVVRCDPYRSPQRALPYKEWIPLEDFISALSIGRVVLTKQIEREVERDYFDIIPQHLHWGSFGEFPFLKLVPPTRCSLDHYGFWTPVVTELDYDFEECAWVDDHKWILYFGVPERICYLPHLHVPVAEEEEEKFWEDSTYQQCAFEHCEPICTSEYYCNFTKIWACVYNMTNDTIGNVVPYVDRHSEAFAVVETHVVSFVFVAWLAAICALAVLMGALFNEGSQGALGAVLTLLFPPSNTTTPRPTVRQRIGNFLMGFLYRVDHEHMVRNSVNPLPRARPASAFEQISSRAWSLVCSFGEMILYHQMFTIVYFTMCTPTQLEKLLCTDAAIIIILMFCLPQKYLNMLTATAAVTTGGILTLIMPEYAFFLQIAWPSIIVIAMTVRVAGPLVLLFPVFVSVYFFYDAPLYRFAMMGNFYNPMIIFTPVLTVLLGGARNHKWDVGALTVIAGFFRALYAEPFYLAPHILDSHIASAVYFIILSYLIDFDEWSKERSRQERIAVQERFRMTTVVKESADSVVRLVIAGSLSKTAAVSTLEEALSNARSTLNSTLSNELIKQIEVVSKLPDKDDVPESYIQNFVPEVDPEVSYTPTLLAFCAMVNGMTPSCLASTVLPFSDVVGANGISWQVTEKGRCAYIVNERGFNNLTELLKQDQKNNNSQNTIKEFCAWYMLASRSVHATVNNTVVNDTIGGDDDLASKCPGEAFKIGLESISRKELHLTLTETFKGRYATACKAFSALRSVYCKMMEAQRVAVQTVDIENTLVKILEMKRLPVCATYVIDGFAFDMNLDDAVAWYTHLPPLDCSCEDCAKEVRTLSPPSVLYTTKVLEQARNQRIRPHGLVWAKLFQYVAKYTGAIAAAPYVVINLNELKDCFSSTEHLHKNSNAMDYMENDQTVKFNYRGKRPKYSKAGKKMPEQSWIDGGADPEYYPGAVHRPLKAAIRLEPPTDETQTRLLGKSHHVTAGSLKAYYDERKVTYDIGKMDRATERLKKLLVDTAPTVNTTMEDIRIRQRRILTDKQFRKSEFDRLVNETANKKAKAGPSYPELSKQNVIDHHYNRLYTEFEGFFSADGSLTDKWDKSQWLIFSKEEPTTTKKLTNHNSRSIQVPDFHMSLAERALFEPSVNVMYNTPHTGVVVDTNDVASFTSTIRKAGLEAVKEGDIILEVDYTNYDRTQVSELQRRVYAAMAPGLSDEDIDHVIKAVAHGEFVRPVIRTESGQALKVHERCDETMMPGQKRQGGMPSGGDLTTAGNTGYNINGHFYLDECRMLPPGSCLIACGDDAIVHVLNSADMDIELIQRQYVDTLAQIGLQAKVTATRYTKNRFGTFLCRAAFIQEQVGGSGRFVALPYCSDIPRATQGLNFSSCTPEQREGIAINLAMTYAIEKIYGASEAALPFFTTVDRISSFRIDGTLIPASLAKAISLVGPETPDARTLAGYPVVAPKVAQITVPNNARGREPDRAGRTRSNSRSASRKRKAPVIKNAATDAVTPKTTPGYECYRLFANGNHSQVYPTTIKVRKNGADVTTVAFRACTHAFGKVGSLVPEKTFRAFVYKSGASEPLFAATVADCYLFDDDYWGVYIVPPSPVDIETIDRIENEVSFVDATKAKISFQLTKVQEGKSEKGGILIVQDDFVYSDLYPDGQGTSGAPVLYKGVLYACEATQSKAGRRRTFFVSAIPSGKYLPANSRAGWDRFQESAVIKVAPDTKKTVKQIRNRGTVVPLGDSSLGFTDHHKKTKTIQDSVTVPKLQQLERFGAKIKWFPDIDRTVDAYNSLKAAGSNTLKRFGKDGHLHGRGPIQHLDSIRVLFYMWSCANSKEIKQRFALLKRSCTAGINIRGIQKWWKAPVSLADYENFVAAVIFGMPYRWAVSQSQSMIWIDSVGHMHDDGTGGPFLHAFSRWLAGHTDLPPCAGKPLRNDKGETAIDPVFCRGPTAGGPDTMKIFDFGVAKIFDLFTSSGIANAKEVGGAIAKEFLTLAQIMNVTLPMLRTSCLRAITRASAQLDAHQRRLDQLTDAEKSATVGQKVRKSIDEATNDLASFQALFHGLDLQPAPKPQQREDSQAAEVAASLAEIEDWNGAVETKVALSIRTARNRDHRTGQARPMQVVVRPSRPAPRNARAQPSARPNGRTRPAPAPRGAAPRRPHPKPAVARQVAPQAPRPAPAPKFSDAEKALIAMAQCEASCADYNKIYACGGNVTLPAPVPRTPSGASSLPYKSAVGGLTTSLTIQPGDAMWVISTPDLDYPVHFVYVTAALRDSPMFNGTAVIGGITGGTNTVTPADIDYYAADNVASVLLANPAFQPNGLGYAGGDPRSFVNGVNQTHWSGSDNVAGAQDITRDAPPAVQYNGGTLCVKVNALFDGAGMIHYLGPNDNPNVFGIKREPQSANRRTTNNRLSSTEGIVGLPSFFAPDPGWMTSSTNAKKASMKMAFTLGASDKASQVMCMSHTPSQPGWLRGAFLCSGPNFEGNPNYYFSAEAGCFPRSGPFTVLGQSGSGNPASVWAQPYGVMLVTNDGPSAMVLELMANHSYSLTLDLGLANAVNGGIPSLVNMVIQDAPRTSAHDVDFNDCPGQVAVASTPLEARRKLMEMVPLKEAQLLKQLFKNLLDVGMDTQILFPTLVTSVEKASSRRGVKPITVYQALRPYVPQPQQEQVKKAFNAMDFARDVVSTGKKVVGYAKDALEVATLVAKLLG